MSRSRRRVAVLMCAGALLWEPSAAAAQQVTPAALEAQLDSLLPLVRRAQADYAAAKARAATALERLPRVHIDTVRVGPLRVAAFPDEVDVARVVVEAAWQDYAGMVGHSPALDRAVLGFSWHHPATQILLDDHGRRVEAPRWRTRPYLDAAARSALAAILAKDLRGTSLGRWNNQPIREPTNPQRIYRELAVTPSRADRACFGGDPAACWSALGLDLDAGAVDAWWTPDEQKLISLQIGWNFLLSPDLREPYEACRDRNDQPACVRFAHGLPLTRLVPLHAEARASMLWLALQKGGPGALDRVLSAPDATPAEALRLASGLTSEELASAWLDWVRKQRPVAYSGLGSSGGVAFAWFLFYGLLALGSTRWRLES